MNNRSLCILFTVAAVVGGGATHVSAELLPVASVNASSSWDALRGPENTIDGSGLMDSIGGPTPAIWDESDIEGGYITHDNEYNSYTSWHSSIDAPPACPKYLRRSQSAGTGMRNSTPASSRPSASRCRRGFACSITSAGASGPR